MHLYVMMRGIKNWQDQFVTELQGKYLPFKFTDPKDNSKLADCNVQLSIRPIQLYEIVFPEESKDVVLNTILGKNFNGQGTQHKKHKKFIWGIRKALGCDPIPEYKTDMEMPVCKQHVEVVGIGVKKDYYQHPDGRRKDEKFDGAFEAL